MEKEVVLKSTKEYGERLPSEPVGWLLSQMPDLALRAVRMRFEGRSTVRGVRPGWLENASDIRIIDVYGEDDAHVVFDCPTLGEGAPEFYRQRQLWSSRPEADLTALELVGDAITELRNQDRDSSFVDKGLLKSVRRLSKAVGNGFSEISLPGGPSRDSVPIDQAVIETAGEFLRTTPRPQRVRVSGILDMVRASTSAFEIVLDDGRELAGVLIDNDVQEIKHLLEKPVMVQGTAIFRPSGNVLRIEASSIYETNTISEIWSEMPRARRDYIDRSELVERQGPNSGVAAIMGAWPGDETDEEIAELLEEIS